MRRSLDSCRTLITGASSGIGRALAKELSRRGARLLVTARREELLQGLVNEIQGAGGDAHCLAGDIADADHRRCLLEEAKRCFGGLDLLVNNAGLGAYGPFEQADEARLRKIMEVNFFAPAELSRAALPLLKQGRRPMIVNIGSVLGHRAMPNKSEYCASKFALHGLSDALRAELAGHGIDVLLVSPSTTASEFFDRVIDRPSAPPAALPFAMTPESVARAIAKAICAGKHEIILSYGGKALVWVDRLVPSVVNWAIAKYASKSAK